MQERVKKPTFDVIGTRPVRPDGVDKVTGRAKFGADLKMAGQLVGKVLRSPHAHARIKSIDTAKALALPGVKAIVTREDFADQASEFVPAGEMLINYRDVVRNVLAREKALYEGHAIAAVAAISESAAQAALDAIKVDYEVLPHVIDEVEAMKPGRAAAARRPDHGGRHAAADQGVERRQAGRVRARRYGEGLCRRPTSSSSASSRPRPSIRATSSRTPASRPCRRTAPPNSG